MSPHFTKEDAKRISQPTLLVIGDRTIKVFNAIVGKLHKAMPNNEVVIMPSAGYITYLDKPGECNQAILKFLTEHSD
jgi:pimeloyl-ACP methyl ester carboxylesterase